MEVINKKLRPKLYSILIISLLTLQLCFGANREFVRVVNDDTDYTKNHFEFLLSDKTNLNCQTLTYLRQHYERDYLENFYKKRTEVFGKDYYADLYAEKIKAIGNTYFENLINSTIEKEIELKDGYYVFYHGQKLEFLLFQDLFASLYEIFYKKTLPNFFLLRVPDKAHKKFKTVSAFLKYYTNNGKINQVLFDGDEKIRKILLSVNSSFFGGNQIQAGDCTFSYFLSSDNWLETKMLNLIKSIFKFYKNTSLFKKYENEINNLINLLSDNPYNKTGLLLQIFIPKNKIDDLVYRSIGSGNLYRYPASEDLRKYQSNTFNDSEILPQYTFDLIQFRILINEEMLNPASGIKMFRYSNETENVKEYKRQLNELVKLIANDLNKNESI